MADSPKINEAQVSSASKDPMECTLYGTVNGLYYYYLESGLYGSQSVNTTVLGTTDAIANVAYVPFLNIKAKDLLKVPYDKKRFGTIEDKSPSVFRFHTDEIGPAEMDLVTADLYPTGIKKPDFHDKWDPNKEARLYNYPYRIITFTSNVFDEYDVVPHLMITEDNKVPLKACCPVTPGGNFYIYVPGYKGMTNLGSERLYSSSSMDIANTSSAYSTYMATQKARTAVNTGSGIAQGIVGAVSGGLMGFTMGGPAGAAVGAAVGAAGGVVSAGSAIASNMAMKSDLRTTPNALKSAGGDIVTRLGHSQVPIVYACEKVIENAYQIQLAKYFHMYGYKINRILPINIRNRFYFNYCKTIGCNIKGDGVPKKHLATIKAIFDKGATFWHVDRVGVEVGNYTMENAEYP